MRSVRFVSNIIGLCVVIVFVVSAALADARAKVSIEGDRWRINGELTYPDTTAEGLLMNVRMVNSVFEDRKRPDFDADANTEEFITRIPEYISHGIRAFTICLQGGFPGYEGAVNSAFKPDGSLRETYMRRVRKAIEACDRQGAAVILGCYYQRQDQLLEDEDAVRAGVVNVANWIRESKFGNVVLEVANEFGHDGFDHAILKTAKGQAELIRLAKNAHPKLLVSTSGLGSGRLPDEVARASEFLLIHFNTTKREDYSARIGALKKYGKPIVCNEDEKCGEDGARAARLCVANGASWGLMENRVNQHFPFHFRGPDDDAVVYRALKTLTTTHAGADYFPPPESQGGWRKLDDPDDIRRLAGMDPAKLEILEEWLLKSDNRDFAAVVIRRGYVVLEVERDRSAVTATGNIKSCAKAICATVLAIASEESQKGHTPKRMTFADPAFDYIPWARPLSDPRKARITIRQLLNHTSGVTPESSGARNRGPWQWILGHTGDPKTEKLVFDPGTDLDYSTHGLYHAALVCEDVAGMPYDRFTIQNLFKPLGIEKWWFEYFDGDEKHGRHPSHALGLPAREMARIAYCMVQGGRWKDRQVIPKWFIEESAAPTHSITGRKTFDRDAESWSHGWELPARLTDGRGRDIPEDARFKPGSGGQLIAFVPSLDLVVTRQTGSSGNWEFEDYLRRACAAVLPETIPRQVDPAAFYFPPPGDSIDNQDKRRPEEVGLKPEIISRLRGKATGKRWALWRCGRLVHVEGDFNEKTEVASLRKTWHALTVGAAIKQGKIPSLHQKISVWNKDLDGKDAEASWWHVITQTSGFDYPCDAHPAYRPGEMWTYSDKNPTHLCNALARVYGRTNYRDRYDEVIRQAYFDAIGMRGWSTSPRADGIRFHFDLEDMGRLGLLVLARGRWNGVELIPKWFVEELEAKQTRGVRVNYDGPDDGKISLDPAKFPEAPYGFMTWVNTDGDFYPGADRAWAWGAGAGGTYILWNRRNGIVFAGIGVNTRTTADGIPHVIEACLIDGNEDAHAPYPPVWHSRLAW